MKIFIVGILKKYIKKYLIGVLIGVYYNHLLKKYLQWAYYEDILKKYLMGVFNWVFI